MPEGHAERAVEAQRRALTEHTGTLKRVMACAPKDMQKAAAHAPLQQHQRLT
jgi:hypothetical protein